MVPFKLKFMEQQSLNPALMTCPHCEATDRIGIHSAKERRYRCHHCRQTFAETTGTVFSGLHDPSWVIVVVVTLLAHGCPVAAIVTAFCLAERTVRLWWDRAGEHGKALQEQLVCQGQIELGQVQLDELCVTTQHGKIWVAPAMSVFSRLFLWGDVAESRNSDMVLRVLAKVKDAASRTTKAVVFAGDGFAASPKAILKTFFTKEYTGRPGRPRHIVWPNLHIVQVIKSRQGKRLKEVTRHFGLGCPVSCVGPEAWLELLAALNERCFGQESSITFVRCIRRCKGPRRWLLDWSMTSGQSKDCYATDCLEHRVHDVLLP